MTKQPASPSFVELFTPKLVTVLREGYGLAQLRADMLAGLTVAIIALPLSMAIAIASGVGPERGLFTAIVGGFLVCALGGSRFQIGGPAGAFIVLVAATVAAHGIDGLLLATMMAGVILMAIGFLRLGTFIKYIPYPVTVGFTSGIAVIIFASQIKELLGLRLAGPEPGALVAKLGVLARAVPTANPATMAIAALSVGGILVVRRLRPRWPAFLIAVTVATLVAAALPWPIATIASRFGGIPHTLPRPVLPPLSLAAIGALLPAAVSFALLGGIESLLSAVVADSMSGRRHRSNCELVAQGVANIVAPLFGGICVTGTIARTVANVRAGAHGPISGMLHAAFLLLFMYIAAPLLGRIPLAALAGVLTVVAWNMADWPAFITLLRASRGDAVVLLSTFLLVVFRNLTEGILVGFGIGALLFLHRMAQATEVHDVGADLADLDDRPDPTGRPPYISALTTDRDVVVCRITGAFFFGAAANVAAALDRVGARPRAYVIDFSAVTELDSTGAATLAGFARTAARGGAVVYVAAAGPAIRRVLQAHGVRPPSVHYASNQAEAVAAARAELAPRSQLAA